ncbi:hypothetical protein [Leptothoe kymatousa]|uniref:Mediator of RNA polymerase II transcription subunit 21 n=1 Tax=Leptothoe kymatousa TAU-MAC 1615 TaxID=2364775 RepID=A0ABS5Y7H6_9CYAN|nr:hypothetical protein [Leptothoe kymatousa]MBT9313796.1 hypothetical protein [Leptothoe kymatousa TAU-MAC 1615]
MVNPPQFGQGAVRSLQSLVQDALVLLKLVEDKIPMDNMEKPTLKPKVKEAQESVQDLLGALQNTEKLAVKVFESEVEEIKEEVKATNWNQYRRPPGQQG